MKIKKMLLLVVAMVLVCAISVTGTLAYLTAQTTVVTNTFVSASGLVTSLDLDEAEAEYDSATGLYKLSTTKPRVKANSYTVLPETTLPKDPTIHITGKTNIPAFLYVEIVDGTGDNIDWEIAENWTKLDSATGQHKGVVYQYTGTIDTNDDIAILKDNQIKVSKNLNLTGAGQTIAFYAYMAQASIDGKNGAAEIYNACFPAP